MMNRTTGFVLFHVLFFAMMWLSKTVHLIYFEEHNAVVNFGLSYSTMAFAGYFAFFMGHLTDVWGFKKSIVLGGFLYSTGLVLRIFPDSSAIAILSGIIAGVGASTCLGAMRVWMTNIAEGESISRFVGLKNSATALGCAIGCSMVAVHLSNKNLLLGSGLGLLLLTIVVALFLPAPTKREHVEVRSPWAGLSDLFLGYRSLFLTTSVLGITTGFYVSFVGPYLPLIMKDKGLTLTAIGFSTGGLALIRFAISPWIAKVIETYQDKKVQVYILAEILVGLVSAAFILPFSAHGFILLLLFRAVFLVFSTISEELLWLDIFPKDRLGLFFGLNQSAYFIGDFMGGLVNGYVYKTFGLNTSVMVVLIAMILNATLFLALIRKHRGNSWTSAKAA